MRSARWAAMPPALALAVFLSAPQPALSGPTEDLVATLSDEANADWLSFDSYSVEDDGTVVIEGISVTAGMLLRETLPGIAEGFEAAGIAANDPFFSADYLSQNPDAIAGFRDQDPMADDGVFDQRLELRGATMAIDVISAVSIADGLSGYLADPGTLAFSLSQNITFGDPSSPLDVDIDLDMGDRGSITIVTEEAGTAAGGVMLRAELRETEHHVAAGLGVFAIRIQMQLGRVFLQALADMAIQQAGEGVENAATAGMREALEDLQAKIDALPQSGDEAAAGLANWAGTMRNTVAEHQQTLDALHSFAETPGTLTIVVDPAAMDAFNEFDDMDDLNDPAVVKSLFDRTGLRAEFQPAE